MTNEEMLLKILEGQEEIHKLLYDMEKRLDRMEINIDEIESNTNSKPFYRQRRQIE